MTSDKGHAMNDATPSIEGMGTLELVQAYRALQDKLVAALAGKVEAERERDKWHEKWKPLQSNLNIAQFQRQKARDELATAERRLSELEAHAEAMHKWIDRVLSCVERAEQDIGGESMATIIPDGGPIYEAFEEWQAKERANG